MYIDGEERWRPRADDLYLLLPRALCDVVQAALLVGQDVECFGCARGAHRALARLEKVDPLFAGENLLGERVRLLAAEDGANEGRLAHTPARERVLGHHIFDNPELDERRERVNVHIGLNEFPFHKFEHRRPRPDGALHHTGKLCRGLHGELRRNLAALFEQAVQVNCKVRHRLPESANLLEVWLRPWLGLGLRWVDQDVFI
mmetsp:Transcript_21473/g.69467  ORF Transcript_21473/g.69467 Transcript_21473/m.69467 type:complete len:202 (+) Transcript_21473:620-1225(+)